MVLLMVASFVQIGIIVDGCIRMNKIILQLPWLRKSERKICLLLLIFVIYVLFFLVFMIIIGIDGSLKNSITTDAPLSSFFGADIVINLTFSTAICLIVYLTLGVNKPRATRTDLRTGKQMTMLFFV